MKKQFGVILVLVVSMLLGGCSNLYEQGRQILYANKEVTQSVFAMDTYMSLKAYGANAEEAVNASIEEINRLDALLSTGKDTSEVSTINKNHGGKLTKDTALLWKRSYEIFSMTGGAFDVTIYPVMKAWGFAGGNKQVPPKDDLDRLLKNVNSNLVTYDQKTDTLTLPAGVELDFGGIAKGYTSQRVIDIMKEYGVTSAVINLGGNVQLLGSRPDGTDNRIGIKSPQNDGTFLGFLEESDKAVITSGGYERFFEEGGKTYHHIINPTTGYPANQGLLSVTIVSDDAALADGLSTALFVMGTDKAITFWKEHSDSFDAVFYTDEKKALVTEGLQKRFTANSAWEIIQKE